MNKPSFISPTIVEIPYRDDTAFYIEKLIQLPDLIFLDSGIRPDNTDLSGRVGRFDIFSAKPSHKLCLLQGKLLRSDTASNTDEEIDYSDKGLLACLNTELSKHSHLINSSLGLPFYGGYAGYFGYGLDRYWSHHRKIDQYDAAQGAPTPDLLLGFYSWAGVVDHQQRKAWLSFLCECPGNLQSEISKLITSSENPTNNNFIKFNLINKLKSNIDVDSYKMALLKIKDYILAGDCYQVNFAQQFTANYTGSPWDAYCRLRKRVSAPFGAYLQANFSENKSDFSILSFSPERFLQLKDNRVRTEPIKGTIPRGLDKSQDEVNAAMLQNSKKNQAENLMIVDLLRNDLGKCCEYGSVKTEKLFELQSFSNVHHLVSSISGKLRNGLTAFDLLQATMPGGSITGAPKSRAVEIIDELETFRRSIYCGAIGYINNNGDMDTNIAIRTLLFKQGELACWAGSGIVADSTWESEYQESFDKVKALLQELEST